jgi:hypothetical protein
MSSHPLVRGLIVIAVLLAGPATATTRLLPLTRIDNPQAIADPTAAIDSRFGAAVAVAGNVLLVGVPRHDAGGFDDRGQVRIFQRAGDAWNAVGSVEGAVAGANFGASLTISGDIVVVGAPGANEARVYRLVGTTLTQVTSLTGGAGENAIGLAVAATAGAVFAGGADALVYRTGSGTTWSAQSSIGPSDPTRVAFGSSLAAASGRLLVGDPGQASGSGAVYTGADIGGGIWAVSGKFGQAGTLGLGSAVAWRGSDLAIVGAPGSTVGVAPFAGSVVVRSTAGAGALVQTLARSPPQTGENFGAALAVSGAVVLIGAPSDTAAASGAGALHVLRCQTSGSTPCSFSQRVEVAGGASGDRFGFSVATDGGLAVVGAPRFDPAGSTDAGSIFVYAVDDESLFSDGFEGTQQ